MEDENLLSCDKKVKPELPAIISVNHLNKHFEIIKHHRGITGPFRNLASREATIINAVNGLTFDINSGEMVN